jgi:acetyltransferase-like isoleucine patch superfamily enzyme
MSLANVADQVARRLRWMWARNWMRLSGRGRLGRLATRVAEMGIIPHEKKRLTSYSPYGYVASSACLHGRNISLGRNIFIDDRVMIQECQEGGDITLHNGVRLYHDTVIQYGQNGQLIIGEGTCVQARCQFSAYKGKIEIGRKVDIAPQCAFYPYNHTYGLDQAISGGALVSAGGITIEDDAWLGFGVIVLDGVTIGKGAVIGAGSVVCHDIPANAIAMGHPAKVVDYRL